MGFKLPVFKCSLKLTLLQGKRILSANSVSIVYEDFEGAMINNFAGCSAHYR
jgi:hypothetical protein